MERRNSVGVERLRECEICRDRSVFRLEEEKSNILISTERKCQQIQVDGKLDEIQPIKCDWCIRDYENGECLFIELKGSDWEHAIAQIKGTIKWFNEKVRPYRLAKDAYVVMSGKRPPADNSRRKMAEVKFRREYQCVLRITRPGVRVQF